MFEKTGQQSYSSIEIVINKYEPMNKVIVIVKIVQPVKLQLTNRGLSLKEYKVTDDGKPQ